MKSDLNENKQLYIFIQGDIHTLGGGALYISGYMQYLKALGWDVLIISSGTAFGKSNIEPMNNYIGYCNNIFSFKPCQFTIEEIANIKFRYLHGLRKKYKKIYIESENFISGLWGELFAEYLGCKHIVNDIEEPNVVEDGKYKGYMDYFKYKYEKEEFYGNICESLIDETIKKRKFSDEELNRSLEINPICDVYNPKVNGIMKKDYNITYIGRPNKKYFSLIIESIRNFGIKYSTKSIQFIVTGQANDYFDNICQRLLSVPNISVFLIGNIYPIPRQLFEKSDVIIAGAQSGLFSAFEGKPVIMPEAETCMSNGIIGYTCKIDEFFRIKNKKKYSIFESLEDALVYKTYLDCECELPLEADESEFYKRKLKRFIKIDNDDNDYFNVLDKREKHWKESFEPFNSKSADLLSEFIKKLRSDKRKLIIFGAGNEGKECKKWLDYMNYDVYIFADNDRNKWDGKIIIDGLTVYNPEQLKTIRNEILIVIATNKNNADVWKQLEESNIFTGDNCIDYRCLRFYPIV